MYVPPVTSTQPLSQVLAYLGQNFRLQVHNSLLTYFGKALRLIEEKSGKTLLDYVTYSTRVGLLHGPLLKMFEYLLTYSKNRIENRYVTFVHTEEVGRSVLIRLSTAKFSSGISTRYRRPEWTNTWLVKR